MSNKKKLIELIGNKLNDNRNKLTEEWKSNNGEIAKHFIIDNLLPQSLCLNINDAFPDNNDFFYQRNSFRERKKTFAKLYTLPNILSDITYAFHDKKIINLISEITKINNLYADENLYAGGLSIMSKNDFLNPHIDNSHDIHRRHYRRLNLLYYVAKDWNINDGGNLELWNTKVSIQKTIFSKFNRLVVMNTDRKSWHSVSKVLSQKNRYCVSNYYFSPDCPEPQEKYFHVTSFTGRPDELSKRTIGYFDNFLRNSFSKIFSEQTFFE